MRNQVNFPAETIPLQGVCSCEGLQQIRCGGPGSRVQTVLDVLPKGWLASQSPSVVMSSPLLPGFRDGVPQVSGGRKIRLTTALEMCLSSNICILQWKSGHIQLNLTSTRFSP